MDKKYMQENEIAIKYLRNQLSDKELEAFEVYLIENPEVLETLELDSFFSASEFPKTEKFSGFFTKFRQAINPNPVFATLFFAMVAAVFVFVPSGIENDMTAVYVVELENLRSSSQIENTNRLYFEKIDQSKQIALTFHLPDEHPTVEAKLFAVDQDTLGACQNGENPISQSEVGFIESKYSFLVPKSKMGSGDYVVCISSNESLINQYRVSVVKK